MTLQLDLDLQRGALHLRVALEVRAAETLAIVGPNGAGKTTLLQAVAGLVRLDRGMIQMNGQLFDAGPGATWLPPQQRGLGYVFQDHRLFPGLTVLDNAAFGLLAQGQSKPRARAAAQIVLEGLGVGDCARLMPAQLSGGQSQRVALARALAPKPSILLLDEPLAAVDASARLALRRSLKAQLRSFAGIGMVVVHDIEDAVALADRIAVMEAGRLVQVGSVAEVVQRPASQYASDLVGLNFYSGISSAGSVRVDDLDLVVATDVLGPVTLTIHPRAVSLFLERPQGSPRNSWQAKVTAIDANLGRCRVVLDGPMQIVAEVTNSAIDELSLTCGREIWVTLKATEIVVAPA